MTSATLRIHPIVIISAIAVTIFALVGTAAGVAGGAYAGHQVEKTMKKTQSYKITVRMNDGADQVFNQNTAPGLAIGEKVKIENGGIVRQ